MKNIAVFVHSFSIEYSDLIISGIYSYFKDRTDVRVYFAQTAHPHFSGGMFDYMHWSTFEYFKSDIIDEVIFVSNSYSVYIAESEIKKLMRPLFVKKFISVGFDLEPGKTYYAITSCEENYTEIVNYLKNKQNCTKIAFYSANLQKNQEALGRYEAFKHALQKNGLEFHEDWVFDGDFTNRNVKETLHARFKSKKEIPFEAIISANDQMGMAVLDFFAEIGMKVPEEMKVFGLDNTFHSILSDPTLATIDQNIEEFGYKIADFSIKLLEPDNKIKEHGFVMPMKVIYRKSCGSGDNTETKKRSVFNEVLNRYRDFRRLRNIFDIIQGVSTIENFISSFKNAVEYSGMTALTIYSLQHSQNLKNGEPIKLSNKAMKILEIDTDTDSAKFYEESEYFDIRKNLFYDDSRTNVSGCFIFQPMFIKDRLYGYMVCRTTIKDFAVNTLVLKIMMSMAVQVLGYNKTIQQKEKLETENKELSERAKKLDEYSKTDELTKLLNRRGFWEYGQRLIYFSEDINTGGVVVFADLDGLKYINDNFGHEYGDKAIKAESDVLRQAFRKMDIIGRLSGDEFGVVASGMNMEFIEKIRSKIDELNEKATKENNFPFTLSISLGVAAFDKGKTDLNTLLKEADKDLYKQKEIHHARIKNKASSK